ncbi:MAG: hypothetical protein JRE23_16150, partial [Deltaproteobacteria bacterium]|nr:hypothetical protein [Deltaproteobacteria bacterium]
MKYLRRIVSVSCIAVLIGFLVVLTGIGENFILGEAIAESNPESVQEPRFFRVYFDKIETAHNIVISMNAIESKYEKGYV